MKRVLKDISLYSSLVASAIAMDDYMEKRKLLANFKEKMTTQITSGVKKNDLATEHINNVAFKTKVETKILELQNSTDKLENIFSDLNQEKDVNATSFEVLRQKAQEEFEKFKETINVLNKSFEDNSKNFSLDDFDQYISAFQDYLGTLTLEQTFCLIHIFAIFALFICLFNLASVFYAESLIKSFNLENKFPKLAKFINIRSKFQQYYFGWNLFLIVTILTGLLYFNLKVFLL